MKQREIKFRALCLVDCKEGDNITKMVYFSQLELDNGLWFNPDDENIYHINEWLTKPMQFTGLTDKNGVEIHEGDILKVSGEAQKYYDDDLFEPPETVGFELMVEVIYNDKIASFDMHTIEPDLNIKNWGFYGEDSQAHIEIIGNIHEHKHLLK